LDRDVLQEISTRANNFKLNFTFFAFNYSFAIKGFVLNNQAVFTGCRCL